jgi:transcriptional regulator with XRE-family HTH domain
MIINTTYMTNKEEYNDHELEFIGHNIRKWRNLRSIKQAEFAKLINVACSTLSKYENNKLDISLKQIQKISFHLNISFLELIKGPEILLDSKKNKEE